MILLREIEPMFNLPVTRIVGTSARLLDIVAIMLVFSTSNLRICDHRQDYSIISTILF